MSHFAALYDACVIYSMPVCDLLMQLALTGTFHAKWSESIHDEWIRSLKTSSTNISEEQLQRRRQMMERAVPDALVQGYETLIPTLDLPDPDDRHVLAAAIASNVSVIVTFNLKHFPHEKFAPWEIEVQHPDDFVVQLFELYPGLVCWSAKTVRARLKAPVMSVDRYLAALRKHSSIL